MTGTRPPTSERKPARVLHVVEATVAGVGTHILQLLNGLPELGVECHVACPRIRMGGEGGDPSFAVDARAAGATVHFVEMRRDISPLHDTASLAALARVIRQGKFDVVHGHSSKGGFLGRLASRLAGVPSVYTPNGLYFLGLPPSKKRTVFVELERLAGRITDRLVAVSDSEAAAVLDARLVPKEKIAVIPNGVPAVDRSTRPAVRTIVRRRLGINEETPIVLVVARLSHQKDPVTFLNAFALSRNGGFAQPICLWCGDGPLREEAESLAQTLGIQDAVRFLGLRDDVPELLLAADAFVLSSIYEGLPYALLEAMAAGLPVIATNVVGNRDMVVDEVNGVLVPPKDPAALARAIQRVLTDRVFATRLGDAAADFITERFSERQTLRLTAQLYRQIIAEG